ncbi:MAG: hypothetical protein IJB97_09190 [Clostridia bacterium]|nr:hypothetical protein [Clostridia bacterium]
MNETKMRKIITSCTVAATLLTVFLLVFIVYQVVTISVQKNREKKLQEEIKQLQELNITNEELAKYYQEIGMEWLAMKYGWIRDQGDN